MTIYIFGDIMIKPSEMTANSQGWRNRQTRKLEVLVRAILCGFKSHLLHHNGTVLCIVPFVVYIYKYGVKIMNSMIYENIWRIIVFSVVLVPLFLLILSIIMFVKTRKKGEKATGWLITLILSAVVIGIEIIVTIGFFILLSQAMKYM